MVVRALLIFTTLSFAQLSSAEIMFEGYYKISQGGVHIGYIINRVEYLEKKQQFSTVSFTKTNELGNNLTESLKTLSTQDMEPISYSYTTLMAGATKTIDAKFDKRTMTATVNDSGKKQKIVKSIPKGVFLSNVLVYMILRSKEGLQEDARYEYQAIAEEDAEILKGVTVIKGKTTYQTVKALQASNEFKGIKFTSVISDTGEILSTYIPEQKLSAELVSDTKEAIGSISLPGPLLKDLFGGTPVGTINALAKSATPDPKGSPKQYGIPGGKGIILKSGDKSSDPKKK